MKAITSLGNLIGEVKEVAFDPNKPQIQEFVRVKVLFDVARPLRRSKVVNLPQGGTAVVRFQYEKVQKRCYECQRLTHEKDYCPILIKRREDLAKARRAGVPIPKAPKIPFLKENNPLFGVLREDQVGIDPQTGRHRIAAEVLEGMRQYLEAKSQDDWHVKVARVKKSVSDVEKDPLSSKTVLRLEPPPIVHMDVAKDKGLVFGYGSTDSSYGSQSALGVSERGISLVSKSDAVLSGSLSVISGGSGRRLVDYSEDYSSSLPCSTEYVPGFYEAGTSGTKPRKSKARRRPYISKRTLKDVSSHSLSGSKKKKEGLEEGIQEKRKGIMEGEDAQKVARSKKQEIVPNEGLSTI